MKYNIGSKIKNIRIKKNLQQGQFAAMLNLSQSAYSKLENNHSYFTFEQIIHLAYITEAALYEFFPDDLAELQQINFRMQMQDYYNEIQSLKKEVSYQKDLNVELMERNKTLAKLLIEKTVFTPPPQSLSRI
ncbi:hypothetical protein A5893_15600 [Pedobacter psychrophilus]|uniref:HTH cro/C1-type domain-containing protein n=1 Tax=Pedobacter psychrophilus TaxID=1826909 RepID=A0A179DBZ9_9SPHI|nr:helix-turn-helix transcriptional regulator [Pedobacter psychrophilus]OAQ38220.1 hypothetical protein A5893_15600 [Pedobacter psychrophilus]